jgi:arylsulfatase A-like enzyme
VSTLEVGNHSDASPLPTTAASRRAPITKTIKDFATLGFVSAFVLALIEYVDLNFQQSQVFRTANERAVFAVYLSVNLLIGVLAAIVIGLVVRFLTSLASRIDNTLQRNDRSRNKLAGSLILFITATVGLNLQTNAHNYATSVLREAEKLPHAARFVLPLEYLLSYLMIAGILVCGAVLWRLTRASAAWTKAQCSIFRLGLICVTGIAYYVDSRFEVQQYEYSLHRTMFLIVCAGTMSLVASFHLRSSGRNLLHKHRMLIPLSLVVLTGVGFTFIRFNSNQSLKTQLFYRSTQAKQHFKIFNWLLDFDRDGYSSLLGGGDLRDGDRSMNPGAQEVADDGIDNNCIGGDLTSDVIKDWQAQFSAMHSVANPNAQRYNIIYFFIDTLRADHLGAYGYARGTSPNIDRLAARSCVFENAYSPSPYTYEAAPKFMQSSYWDGHLATWTETLARNGYHTMLFPRRISMLSRYVKGMQQVVTAAQKGLKQTIDAAIDELGKVTTDAPFCAYIYSLDPHRPYRPHPDISFGSSLIDQYDSEVAYTDYHLGRLFNWMETSGRMKDTMVVIMADHGESFGERMVYRHNSQVYDDQMKVPAIVYVPGYAPRRIPEFISTVDLAPTILNLVGVACPPHYAGVSLLPSLRGEPLQHPPVYGEHALVENSLASPDKWIEPETRKFMVITQDGFKLIYNRNYYSFELYDLKADPKELNNLFERLPEKSDAMRQLLGRFVDIVSALRPADADEQKHPGGADEETGQK